MCEYVIIEEAVVIMFCALTVIITFCGYILLPHMANLYKIVMTLILFSMLHVCFWKRTFVDISKFSVIVSA